MTMTLLRDISEDKKQEYITTLTSIFHIEMTDKKGYGTHPLTKKGAETLAHLYYDHFLNSKRQPTTIQKFEKNITYLNTQFLQQSARIFIGHRDFLWWVYESGYSDYDEVDASEMAELFDKLNVSLDTPLREIYKNIRNLTNTEYQTTLYSEPDDLILYAGPMRASYEDIDTENEINDSY